MEKYYKNYNIFSFISLWKDNFEDNFKNITVLIFLE